MTEHIRINDVAPRIHYDADGVQSAFTYPFAIFKASDLAVWLGDVRQQAAFTVSGAGISSGGSVLFAVPPPAGTRVTLHRRLVLERISDFQADGIIRAKTLNDELDYLVAALQQVAEDVGRTLQLGPTSASPAELILPEPAAGRGLKWNASGSALVNSDHDPDTLGDAVQAAADVQAAVEMASAARDQAVAVSGGVKVSGNDTTPGPLLTKLVAGTGIILTKLGDGADEQLTIACSAEGAHTINDRLAFLEHNLALTVLRDQIDTGWSVLRMVDGIADEFEDQAGISSLGGASYDAAGYIHNPAIVSVNVASSASVTTGPFAAPSPAVLVDGNTATSSEWMAGAGATQHWVRLDFGSPKALSEARVWLNARYGGTEHIVSVQLQGWTGAAWVDVGASITSVSAGSWLSTGAFSAVSYASWRLFVTLDSAAGYAPYVGEVQLMQAAVAAPNVTVVSVAFTAMAQPAEARVVVLHEAVAAVTPDTDVVVGISRDGGSAWTAASLSDEGAFDANTRLLVATADLSGQPAGVAMMWRLRTLNNKEQRLHGVWLQWRS